MTESNGNDRSTQPGDTPEWVPTADRPWRPIPDDDDSGIRTCSTTGAPWCADRTGHPPFQDDGYPSLNHHRTECRSYDGWFGALAEDGTPGYFSAYLVRPFRFGQERDSTVDELGWLSSSTRQRTAASCSGARCPRRSFATSPST